MGKPSPATRLALVVATFFGAGLAPKAPGTAGTAAALPLAWAVSHLPLEWQVACALGVTLVGMVAAAEAGRYYGTPDAQKIVIDEVAGLLVTMLGVSFRLSTAVAAFVFFRLFDITKPWPASWFDRKMKSGAGVVLDDIAAGVYARLCLAALIWFAPAMFTGS
jgi:phosphatidylglycerophosphatase A